MKTKVAETSIATFHDPKVQASIDGQRIRVARRIIKQTEAGKPSCIGSLCAYFKSIGDDALLQNSRVSRACNEIYHMGSITVDGLLYEHKSVESRKYNGRTVQHFCLVLAKVSTNQLSMF